MAFWKDRIRGEKESHWSSSLVLWGLRLKIKIKVMDIETYSCVCWHCHLWGGVAINMLAFTNIHETWNRKHNTFSFTGSSLHEDRCKKECLHCCGHMAGFRELTALPLQAEIPPQDCIVKASSISREKMSSPLKGKGVLNWSCQIGKATPEKSEAKHLELSFLFDISFIFSLENFVLMPICIRPECRKLCDTWNKILWVEVFSEGQVEAALTEHPTGWWSIKYLLGYFNNVVSSSINIRDVWVLSLASFSWVTLFYSWLVTNW